MKSSCKVQGPSRKEIQEHAVAARRFRLSESYKDLLVWQKAMSLAVNVYRATATFPKEEIYGLTSQVRRATVSIASNIAEGKGRHSNADFQHFLVQARGSVNEVET